MFLEFNLSLKQDMSFDSLYFIACHVLLCCIIFQLNYYCGVCLCIGDTEKTFIGN